MSGSWIRNCWLLLAPVCTALPAAERAPYDLWSEPCLSQPADPEGLQTQLTAAMEAPQTADFSALVCAALGNLDEDRWLKHWQEWNQDSDQDGCGSSEQLRAWRSQLFLSPNVHMVASKCLAASGDDAGAQRAVEFAEGVMSAFLERTAGASFDQGVPLMMPVDLFAYLHLIDREVIAFWGKPYHGGTRMVFKLATSADSDHAQKILYFEWALPLWTAVKAKPGSPKGGPWQTFVSHGQFAEAASQGLLMGPALTYRALAQFQSSRHDEKLLQALRETLQPLLDAGDPAGMFEMAQYEMELPDGDQQRAVDLLLGLAEKDARATAMLAAPTLLAWAGLEGGAESAEALVAKAARQLPPGAAEAYAASELVWRDDALSKQWQERWLARSAELGYAEGAQSYAEFLAANDRQVEARDWIERAASGHVSAIPKLIVLMGKDDPAAGPWLLKAAHWTPSAMRQLAEREDSEDWWQRAALAGDSAAAVRMARREFATDSVEADGNAMRWALWSGQVGSIEGLAMLAAVDLRARSQLAKPERGAKIVERLKSIHYPIDTVPELAFEVARREERGDLLRKNPGRALKMYTKLAAQEHGPSLLRLAENELQGRPSGARSRRAAEWLTRAHAAGMKQAAARLVELYRDPSRLLVDEAEAARWEALKAAAEEDAGAASLLEPVPGAENPPDDDQAQGKEAQGGSQADSHGHIGTAVETPAEAADQVDDRVEQGHGLPGTGEHVDGIESAA